MPNISSGTAILRSCFTFTWQLRRQFSAISLREKYGDSVGRISPPPSKTWHLHMAQVPPPPQADGKKMSFSLNVVNKVFPDSTSSVFSPLISIFTGPEGESFDLANSRTATSNRVRTKNMATDMIIVMVIIFVPCVL